MQEFDTFIFDLDGTLLDTLPDLVALTNRALEESGFPHRTTQEIKSYVGNGARALMYQAVPQDAGDQAVEKAMQRWIELYPIIGHSLTKPYPYIPEVLQVMKRNGVKLGVLSNKYDGGVKQVIPAFFPDVFKVMHGECDDYPRKPDPTGLLKTIDELGSSVERTVYVGDSDGDMEVARRAGVFSLGAAWGYHDADHLEKANADAVIGDAHDLLRFAITPSAF